MNYLKWMKMNLLVICLLGVLIFFKMDENESIGNMFIRFTNILNILKNLGKVILPLKM